MRSVQPDRALALIRASGADGRLLITQVAEERLRKRGVSLRDIRLVLADAKECKAQKDGSWKVKGRDLDGEELALTVSIAPRGNVVVL